MVHICSFQEMKVSFFFFFTGQQSACLHWRKIWQRKLEAKKVIYRRTFCSNSTAELPLSMTTPPQLRRNSPSVSDRDCRGTSSSLTRGGRQFAKVSISFSSGDRHLCDLFHPQFRMLKAPRLPHTLFSRRPTICCRASSYGSPSQEPRPGPLTGGRSRTGSGIGGGWRSMEAFEGGETVHLSQRGGRGGRGWGGVSSASKSHFHRRSWSTSRSAVIHRRLTFTEGHVCLAARLLVCI